jgi:N6-adenosine-specific RNA methylase IME4
MSRALVTYNDACRAIAAAKTIDAAKKISDKHEAMRVLAHQAGNIQVEIDHAELRIRATRRLGELLVAAKAAGQVHRGRERHLMMPARARLEDAGVTRKLSMTAQRLFGLEAELFEAQLGELRDAMAERGARVSLDIAGKVAKAQKLATRRADYKSRQLLGCTREDLVKLSASGARFGVVYADPNWEFRTWSDKGADRSPSQHYDTAPDGDILAYGPLIKSLACIDGAVLLLWVTGPQLPLGLKLIEASGFDYKTIAFIWPKLNAGLDPGAAFTAADFFMGAGHWSRAGGEICLLATLGAPSRLNADVRQTVIWPVGAHSEKPPLHDRIERLCAGPYLELFARAQVGGWTCWGDEIPRENFAGDAVAAQAIARARGRMAEKPAASKKAPRGKSKKKAKR